MVTVGRASIFDRVALHTEGVDRNVLGAVFAPAAAVALHTEGVDRNTVRGGTYRECFMVALHTEGVDRNLPSLSIPQPLHRRPPHGGRG